MSRAGYSEDCDGWELIRWRGAVNSAIKGKRGQAFLKEALALLDAMPVKELIVGELEDTGQFCTLGVVGHARGVDMSGIETTDRESLSGTFDIAEALAAEIMYLNDEVIGGVEWVLVDGKHQRVETANAAARRWRYMRDWVAKNIGADEVAP